MSTEKRWFTGNDRLDEWNEKAALWVDDLKKRPNGVCPTEAEIVDTLDEVFQAGMSVIENEIAAEKSHREYVGLVRHYA